MDHLTPEERSQNMSKIRSGNTKPEKKVRSVLHKLGYRFRLHRKNLPGSPDIVLPKYHSVIFVHGCYWHRHEGCVNATMPKTNTKFWLDKFKQNVKRDLLVKESLNDLGWKVVTVWECEVADQAALEERLTNELSAAL